MKKFSRMYKSLTLISCLLWVGHFSSAQEETNLIVNIFMPMPTFTNYAQWKEGWLKHRTDKMFCKTEDDAKTIITGLKGK
jgi:hypothetical protein